MNKTININLGGYFFHIDETAYQKLRRYLDAISKSLSDDPQGKNEIISDIETRISELLSEKITDARQVVNEQDISDIIKIMGEPEAYAENEEGYADTKSTYQRKTTSSKKLFRDREDRFLAGVSSGIAHYFDIDVIWIRLAFLLTAIFTGFGFIAYIIFWIVTPEAKSTAEKLQMEGEKVTIDNIEKKIREEFSSMKDTIVDGASDVKKKVKDGFQKNEKKAKSGLQDFLDTLGKIIIAFFNVIGKFIGVIIIITSAAVLVSLIIALFSVGSFEILGLGEDFINFPTFIYDSLIPYWILAIALLVLIGFPFLILFVLGLRILSNNVKQFSKTTSFTLLGIWIVALFMLIFTGLELRTSKAYNGNKIVTSELSVQNTDTLHLKMINDDDIFYRSNLRRSSSREIVTDNDIKKAYSNYIKVDVEKSNSDAISIKVRKVSEGRNRKYAKENAENIEYNYTLEGNDLTLNAFFLSKLKHRFSDEVVYVTVYLPEDSVIYFDQSVKNFLHAIYDVDSMYDSDMVNHYFEMTTDGLDCTDCIEEVKEEDLEE